MQLTEFYRRFDLPWEDDPEERERLRRFWLGGLITVLVFGIGVPLIKLGPQFAAPEEAVPPRLARLMVQQERPKPPPKPVEAPKPELKPTEKLVPKPEDVRKKVAQSSAMRTIRDQLADLRDQVDTNKLQTRNLIGNVGADSRSERSLIAAKVGSGSAGITTSSASRGFGGGAGALGTHETTGVSSGLAAAAHSGALRGAGNGKGGRSEEEVALVFDRNQGALYALYSRALRERADLSGKLVLELSIAPSGEVTACRVISSELNDPDLEKKIVTRVKLFRFEAKDVNPMTVTKPIEFFPA